MFEDEIVCLVNRTIEPVSFMYDGHEYTLTPLEEKHVRKPLAEHALHVDRMEFEARDRARVVVEQGAAEEQGEGVDPDERAARGVQTIERLEAMSDYCVEMVDLCNMDIKGRKK